MSLINEILKFKFNLNEVSEKAITPETILKINSTRFLNEEIFCLEDLRVDGKSSYELKMYYYYNFFKDFKRDLRVIKKNVNHILSRYSSYLVLDMITLLSEIENAKIYNNLKSNIENSSILVNVDNIGLFNDFIQFNKMLEKLNEYDFVKMEYEFTSMNDGEKAIQDNGIDFDKISGVQFVSYNNRWNRI